MEELRSESKKKLFKIIKNKSKINLIEKSINNFSIDYCKTSLSEVYSEQLKLIYYSKLNTLLNNLDKRSNIGNTYLYEQVMDDKIDLSKIAYLTPEELFPEKWRKIKELIINKDKINNTVSYTEEFECFKCGCNKTTFFQLQTRSGDEPMTTFIECSNCKNKWKKN